MRIIPIQQGTDDWHALRGQRFTASEAAAVFGQHKYMSRNDLLQLKHTGVAPEPTSAQQRIFNAGHEAEAKARPLAEEIIGSELYPCTVEDDSQTYLASMDGLDMMGEVGFEHKLASVALLAQVASGELEEHYYWQMDHQMMVSGASKILFVASDGTRDKFHHLWYERDEHRITQLIAAWNQFAKDLEAYQPAAKIVEATGEAPSALPALRIDLTGMVTASNLPEFKARALAMIDSIKTEMVDDQDFADAAETVKFLSKGEKQLEASKKAALEQTASIAELFDTIDELRENMRKKRLQIDKLVKAEKENRRLDIKRQAEANFQSWLTNEVVSPVPVCSTLDVAGAMRGKKTIATLQSAAEDEVARAKIETLQEAKRLSTNQALIEKHQGDYRFLFNDWRDLIQKDAEFIKLQVENRIAHHQQEEQKRLDAERARIRQEEQAKAEAEQRRIRQEEENKARAEQERIRQEEAARQAQEQADAEAFNAQQVKAYQQQHTADQEPVAQEATQPVEDKAPMFKMPTPRVSPQRRISDYLMDTVSLDEPIANLVAELILTNQIPCVDVRLSAARAS